MVSRKGFMKRRLHRGPATRRPFRNPLLNAMGYLSPLKSHLQRKKRKEKKERKKERKEGETIGLRSRRERSFEAFFRKQRFELITGEMKRKRDERE